MEAGTMKVDEVEAECNNVVFGWHQSQRNLICMLQCDLLQCWFHIRTCPEA
jgi:hypothetical protein